MINEGKRQYAYDHPMVCVLRHYTTAALCLALFGVRTLPEHSEGEELTSTSAEMGWQGNLIGGQPGAKLGVKENQRGTGRTDCGCEPPR